MGQYKSWDDIYYTDEEWDALVEASHNFDDDYDYHHGSDAFDDAIATAFMDEEERNDFIRIKRIEYETGMSYDEFLQLDVLEQIRLCKLLDLDTTPSEKSKNELDRRVEAIYRPDKLDRKMERDLKLYELKEKIKKIFMPKDVKCNTKGQYKSWDDIYYTDEEWDALVEASHNFDDDYDYHHGSDAFDDAIATAFMDEEERNDFIRIKRIEYETGMSYDEFLQLDVLEQIRLCKLLDLDTTPSEKSKNELDRRVEAIYRPDKLDRKMERDLKIYETKEKVKKLFIPKK